MPKAISVPPPIPKDRIPEEGTQVTITAVRVVKDQWTSIGTTKLGLGIEVDLEGDTYSQLFSMDKEVLTGSIGRILVNAGITDVPKNADDAFFKPLVGKVITVRVRGEKLYWYP